MPYEIVCVLALILIIMLAFLVLKRPIHECMFFGYVLMLVMMGELKNFFTYIYDTSTDTLFYSIVAFLVLAKILDMTKAIDSVVNILSAVFGRFKGGAAYIAVVGSAFMGALSGSGPGNVATTGVFTIPAMKKAGIPAHLAANIESASSTMGNMIPPAGVILAALTCYNEFSGREMSQSTFWLACWSVAIWFILQRILTVFFFCRYYKVQPLDHKNIPNFKESIKKGGKNLLLPVIILLPFVLESVFKNTLFADRLGDGSKMLSNSLLLFTPGVAAVYALLTNRKTFNIKSLLSHISNSVSDIVPLGITIFFAYCISNLFSTTNVAEVICTVFAEWKLSAVALAFIIPLILAVLGMVLPGSALTKIFGTTIITIFASVGVNPLLVAAVIPAIAGAMCGMTPPLALCVYTAMGIAGSKFKETLLNCLIWVFLHYALSVIFLLGLLPVFGV